MCLLPFFTIITYNRGVDIKLRDLITDYIRNNPAIKAAARRDSGIIKADSLDFYPLSRAVKLIAAKRGGRLFAISPTDESARQLFQDLFRPAFPEAASFFWKPQLATFPARACAPGPVGRCSPSWQAQ